MTMMKHIYFASFTVYLQLTLVFFFAIDQASAVASQTIITTSGKLVGVNDGAGGKCLFQSNVRIMLINTSSDASSVISFKKVVSVRSTFACQCVAQQSHQPYAHPPTGNQRWKPPVALVSTQTVDASKLGPSCLQQFPTAPAPPSVVIPIFDTPPPPSENEDCLFL
jgi:Carboxylesterase family